MRRPRPKLMLPSLAVALSASLLAASATAQSPAEPPTASAAETPTFEDRVDVTEVLLDIVAVDKKGRVVEGLGIDDFAVVEDGKPVTLTDVSFYSTRYGRPVNDEAGAEATAGEHDGSELPASRYFVLFFEEQRGNANIGNRLLQQQLDAGRKSRDWIETEMGPSDWVAVLSYDNKLEIHQDFTQDRLALLDAIQAASVKGKDPGIRTPSERRRAIADGPSIFRNLPSGPQLARDTKHMYDALRVTAEASGYLVGRKNLLLFTIGFGRLDSGPFAQPDPRYYPDLEKALNANNVAIYPIDLSRPGVEHLQESFLNQLAFDSGGFYFRNFVSFATPLASIAQENTGYYLLSYRTTRAQDDKDRYRRIKVTTSQRKVKLRAPRGVQVGS